MESFHGLVSKSFGGENLNGEEKYFTGFEMEDKMPFLQMLRSIQEPSSVSPFAESNSFQFLLKLQHQKRPWPEHNDQVQVLKEPESCVSHRCSPPVNRRKRKKTKPPKNREEIESHRMIHIAVERNRRRQMNDHFNELRSLTPPSYVQRGDQASIVGGAIDFIKELEQMLESLQAEKRTRKDQEKLLEDYNGGDEISKRMGEFTAEIKSMVADVHVTLIHNHVDLKIRCRKRYGQLIKAIMALEDLSLTVLHLNVTSLETSVHYSFNLKIEDGCKLRSAIQIAEAIHQIFSLINCS